jgi:hypothetical protein
MKLEASALAIMEVFSSLYGGQPANSINLGGI